MVDNRIPISSSCTISELEGSLRSFFKEKQQLTSIIIDLSDVSYIEAPSVIFLAGFIDSKLDEGVDVKIALPEKKEIRNLLRYFRFPVLLNQLTKKRFQDIVVFDSLKWFGENRNLKGDYWAFINNQKKVDDDSLADSLSRNKIFAEAIPFKDTFDKSNALEKLHSDWTGEEMKAWLKSHMQGYELNKERLIPNRIIYECVTNSQRHSNANKLVFAAIEKEQKKSKEDIEKEQKESKEDIINTEKNERKKFLDISFWDNGDTIIKTLKTAIDSGLTIKDEKLDKDNRTQKLQATYFVKYKDNEFDNKLLNSDINPTIFKKDEGLILLASFFPGISKDPFGKDQWQINPDFINEDTALAHPGMGLTTLLNAAIDLLGGQVSVRVENYFINIKKPVNKKIFEVYKNFDGIKYEKFYQAKIEKYENAEPKLKGNMLTVRLPLKSDL